MQLYEVLLGIDRAARDTGRRISMRILGVDRLSAAIAAESMADQTLGNPEIEYTHAINVSPINTPEMALALAA